MLRDDGDDDDDDDDDDDGDVAPLCEYHVSWAPATVSFSLHRLQ